MAVNRAHHFKEFRHTKIAQSSSFSELLVFDIVIVFAIRFCSVNFGHMRKTAK